MEHECQLEPVKECKAYLFCPGCGKTYLNTEMMDEAKKHPITTPVSAFDDRPVLVGGLLEHGLPAD